MLSELRAHRPSCSRSVRSAPHTHRAHAHTHTAHALKALTNVSSARSMQARHARHSRMPPMHAPRACRPHGTAARAPGRSAHCVCSAIGSRGGGALRRTCSFRSHPVHEVAHHALLLVQLHHQPARGAAFLTVALRHTLHGTARCERRLIDAPLMRRLRPHLSRRSCAVSVRKRLRDQRSVGHSECLELWRRARGALFLFFALFAGKFAYSAHAECSGGGSRQQPLLARLDISCSAIQAAAVQAVAQRQALRAAPKGEGSCWPRLQSLAAH
jgi:hypothetical protein